MQPANQRYETVIPSDCINGLIDWLPNNEWFPLANNVEKLANETEVDGIGKYLYIQGFKTTDCQTASHVVTIFHQAGIWLYNEKIRGLKFRKNLNVTDWCNLLTDYYRSHIKNCNL
jgi:hypothetical protein